MKSAVFFERDGILNLVEVENDRPVTPLSLERFTPNPAAKDVLLKLKQDGFVLLATTNQPGLSRGYQSRRELDMMHDALRRNLPLDDILLCPHDEADECPCRRPSPGLLTEAAFQWHLDLERSFVVSDKWQDARAAHLVGCTSLLLRSPWIGHGHHDFVLNDIAEVPSRIAQLQSSSTLLMNQMV